MTDVSKLLEEESNNYGDDFEESDSPKFEPRPPTEPRGSILAQAAQTIDREENDEVKQLLESNANRIKSVSSRTKDENDPLSAAAAELAFDGGDDDDDDNDDDDDDKENNKKLGASLQIACFHGDLKQARSLLDKGASIKYRDRHGWLALHWAASSNTPDIARMLIKAASSDMTTRAFKSYINAQAKGTGWTPLHVAVVRGSLETLEVLLDNPCCRVEQKDRLGETAAECIPNDKGARWGMIRRALGVESVRVEDEGKDGEEKQGEGKEGLSDDPTNRAHK